MKRHELSALFGDMPADQFARLANDIKAYGLREPITVLNGEVLDGWHRYKACMRAGVEPYFAEFTGDDREALALVVSKNARRRHLTDAAIVSITKKVLGWHEAAAQHGGDRSKVSADTLTASNIAEAAGVSVPTVKRHTALERKAPALLPMVERGEIGLATADAAIRNASVEVLEKATPEEVKALAAAVNDRLSNRIAVIRRAARDLREQWAVLSKLDSDEVRGVCFEVRLILGGELFAALTGGSE